MVAKDTIHQAVKNALIKDGWTIIADPYTIRYGDDWLYADLAAERIIAAEQAGHRIIVEVKSFTGRSEMQDFKLALGQYMLYLPLVNKMEPDSKLYLAVSEIVYDNALQREAIKLALEHSSVPLIVVQVKEEVIVKWIR
jgi:hypothetical protein